MFWVSALGQATTFAALQQSDERFRTVMDNAPIILTAFDTDGIFTLAEGRALAARGRASADMVGRSAFEFYAETQSILDRIHGTLSGEIGSFTTDKNGVALETSYIPLWDADGTIKGGISLSIDVTARVRAEQALRDIQRDLERSNAELQQFAYVASHDLQEPLRTIASYLQLIAQRYKGQLDDDADVFIQFAVDGAKRMQALIKAVLQYSQVGNSTDGWTSVDSHFIVASVVDSLRAHIAALHARVTWDALPTIVGDPNGLSQLFQNLIGNALKFCSEDPTVHIGVVRENDEWTFSIQDNGIGIAPDHLERVFGMFQRLHTREEYEGTGIGLATCKKIVERHGGRIWVESELGHSTTFFFTLPAS